MEWWTVFRKIRKMIFIIIAITSLLWAILLSIYLTQEWRHFSVLQRSIVIGGIAVNAVSAIMQYLMIVVIFRMWMDFVRTLILIALHAASAVLFTLFGSGFSCAVWDSESICQDVDLVILVGAWTSTGLLLGYVLYLLIMSRVPIPLPKITPNLLISTPPSSRPPSMASANSATLLLDVEKQNSPVAPFHNEETSPQTRTVPKKFFVVNGMPSPVSPAQGSPQSRASMYSATGSPTYVPGPSRPSGLRNSLINGLQTFAQKRLSRPEPLPLPNPFLDPVPRNGTPDSVFSTLTFSTGSSLSQNSSSSNLSFNNYRPVGDFNYSLPYGLSGVNELTVPDDKSKHEPDSPSTIYSLYATEYQEPDISTYPLPYKPLTPSPAVRSAALSVPPRHHTQTPSSVHSISPSLHFHEQPVNRALPPPQPAHLRGYSDPVYRPYTASPRLVHETINHPPALQSSRPPTASVRRHGSLGYSRGAFIGSREAHFQEALGRPPPKTVNTSPTLTRAEWKQLVMNAAVAGT